MAMRSANKPTGVTTNPTLVGAAIVLAVILTVFLSYNANKGLPYVPTFLAYGEVPDAAELVEGSEVRIGGARVGQVTEIQAMPPKEAGGEPYAELTMELQRDLEESIPVDTKLQIRPRSILGAKYVDLTFGKEQRKLVQGGRLPIEQAIPTPELDEAFNVFDKETSRGLRDAIINVGDSLAGRGSAINETIHSSRRLLPPLQRVLRVLGAERTDLDGFIASAAAVTSALAPQAETLGDVFENGATTLAAIDAAGDSLGRSIDELAATEIVGVRALRRVQPVLDDAAALTRALRPGTRRLPQATRRLAQALETGTPVLRRVPRLSTDLSGTLAALDKLAKDPAVSGAVRKLLATVSSLGPTLRTLLPAQLQCNVAGLWGRNVPSVISEGDAAGTWLSLILVMNNAQGFQSSAPAPDLHVNHTPNENAAECEAGNEPFAPGRQIGNPPGNQPNTTQATAPPPGTLDRARRAGLLDRVRGLGR